MFDDRDEYMNLFESTTEQSSNADYDTDVDILIEKIVNMIYLVYTPTIVILGTFGNGMSLFVFYSSKMRLQSSSQYLSTLAVADNLFLWQLIPPWLNATGLTTVFHRTGFCQIFVYLSYVSCCLSAWLVVAFTVERFVAVVYPLHQSATCSVHRSRQIIFALIVIAVILNLPVLRFAAPTKNDCNINRKYLDHAARFNLVDTILSFTLPLGAIIVLNTWIMIGIRRLERTRRELMMQEQQVIGRRERRRRLARLHQCQHKVTRMLVLVSSVFVVLNLPAYTIRMMAYAYDINANHVGRRWMALQQLAVMFFHTNFGINFLLYCLSGQNYRRAMYQAFRYPRLPWVRRQARREVVVRFACEPQVQTNSGSATTNGNTEPTATVTVEPAPRNNRRGPRNKRIKRWKFNNSRQQRNNAPASDPVPGPSTVSVPGPSTVSVPGPSTVSVPGPSTVSAPVPVHGRPEEVEMRWFGAIGRYSVFPPTLLRPLSE